MSRDSSVGIVTGYGLDGRGLGLTILAATGNLSLLPKPALEFTQPPIQWIPPRVEAAAAWS
jgi:hypothetical protein